MAENMFSILLKAILDENASASEIKRQVDNLSKKASDVQLGVKIDDKEIERLRREIANIQKELENDNLTTKERSRLLKEMNQMQRTLNTESRAFNQQNKQDLAHQRTQLSAIASAQKDAVSLKRSQQQLAKMENAEIEKENNNLREQKSLLSSMKTWHSKQTVGSMAQTGLFGVDDLGELKTAQSAYDQLISQIESGKISIKDAKTEFQLLKDGIIQLGDTVKKVDEIQLLSNGGVENDYATQIAKLEGDFRSLGLAQDTIATKTQNVKNSLATLRAEFAKPVDQQNFQAIQTANDNLQRELIESRNEFEQLRASMKGMATEQQRLSLANTIEAWNQKNTAATKAVREENERYVLSLRDLSNQMTRMDFNKINTGFKQNENSMRALNRLGASLKDQFSQAYRSFTMWLSASTMVMKVISETREAFTELKKINTILTEISKANENLTKDQLTQIGNNSFDIASKYGKTATDFLSGVQEASRAGYENAEAMAELSTAAQGAGDMTADVANQFIIATDKAYKLGGSVQELTKMLDGVNYITNHNAVNMTELSEAMTIVGSTAASFGVETDELTAALGTMAATTQQSGSEVARAFRAILLNIRQVSDEEEGIDAEGLTKYEKACNALGVSLKETRNGVLQTRDAMDVLRDLSVEYSKLEENDLKRTNLLNSVGGKLRSTQLDALLRNWSTYETMLQQYADGTGSMQREADIICLVV